MNIPNRITLNDLRGMQVGAIAALSGEELAPLRLEAEDQLRTAKGLCDWLDGAIALKYGDRANAARNADGKDTGTIRFADGAVTVVAELPKRVDWDQAQVASLVERIKADGDDPTEYVDISFDVAERKYSAWPAHIRMAFEGARTVRTGKQRFRLSLNDEVTK
ncbi:hypothetical protein GCM10010873_33470 [Cypionkella aquatica]|uniref:Uncharacterized protein n=1 Tax=Cypionkella aquatica TaxID=1756042 RepID=A0AA37U067_9RHOB|nr:hypothetical protein [Cypionkella aquatica]GLS88373.1 hypothetical protein GCM10010873_33470 [Cypionkella aquatica]